MQGHSSIGITMDLYSHVSPTLQQEAVSKLDNLVFGESIR
jgi:integrase